MRDFKFTEQERPTMSNFNARFDAIAALANGLGNEYVWEKQLENNTFEEIITSGQTRFAVSNTTFLYGTGLQVKNNAFVLENEQSLVTTSSDWKNVSVYNVLKGKYVIVPLLTGYGYEITFVPNEMTFSYSDNTVWINTTSDSPHHYYKNPTTSYETVGYVNSPDPNAYPPADDDGYTYTALGQLGAKVQIATGSYTGTGTYGSSNQNSLTFDFVPKFIYIQRKDSETNPALFPYISGCSNYTVQSGGAMVSGGVANINDKTFTWYTTQNDAAYQMNISNAVYNYIAIG